MCGVIGYIGPVSTQLLVKLIDESLIRGMHNVGTATSPNKMAGIMHTRYCTSGKDNQPIKIGPASMVFNGVIDMGTKAEMEKRYKIKMVTDNDGEIIMHLGKTPEEAVKFLSQSKASFAGLWLTKAKLFAIRNDKRPLWMVPQGGAMILASTKDILIRAGLNQKKMEQLEPLKIYQWQI